MKPHLKFVISAVLLWTCSTPATALDDSKEDAWRVLHTAIESRGPNADEVYRLLGTINDAEARKLLNATLKAGGWAAYVSAQGLSPDQCRTYLSLLKPLALDPSVGGKQFVLGAIAKLSSAEAADILQEIADKDEEPASGMAFGLLESLGQAATVALARESHIDRTAPKRETAVYTLTRIAHRDQLPTLRAAIRDSDPGVRFAAALGLVQVGSPEGESELELALANGSADNRREAAVALAALGSEGAVARLKSLLSTSDQAEKARIVWTIARIGGARLKTFVYESRLQKQPEFASMIAEKLLDTRDPRDLLTLSELLGSPDESARIVAAERLLNTRFSAQAQAVITTEINSQAESARRLALDVATSKLSQS